MTNQNDRKRSIQGTTGGAITFHGGAGFPARAPFPQPLQEAERGEVGGKGVEGETAK